ncbi:MAG: hydrogenase expression/formation protein HypE [Endomicrobiales bacterium]|nr:hydrogenase expression/formation protein HypE [Endomicrobiales bacterium]
MKTNRILLAHGAGGRLTNELIKRVFRKKFLNPELAPMDDGAVLKSAAGNRDIVFTTDSFVVDPLFFPGGDIGKLAVCGTVNDLAMMGAKPYALTIAAIIEEGLDISVLEKVADSIMKSAREAGVKIVAGDTKVVERGKADKLFLTSSGVGFRDKKIRVSGSNARPGDSVLINGAIAEHGMAVVTARNDFKLKAEISSDCAPLGKLVQKMIRVTKGISVLRDPTRGGLATTLNEIASSSNAGIIVDEKQIPIKKQVESVCNILGFDPLYVANEGKLVAMVPENQSSRILSAMKKEKHGKASQLIGKVVKSPKGVWLRTRSGGLRPLVMLEGEQLPRIC